MDRIPHAAELADRRDAPRVAVDKQYSIRLNPGDGREPVLCGLVDYSVTGMRLELPSDMPLPAQVSIIIGELSHTARVAWRNGSIVGVDFIDEHYSIY